MKMPKGSSSKGKVSLYGTATLLEKHFGKKVSLSKARRRAFTSLPASTLPFLLGAHEGLDTPRDGPSGKAPEPGRPLASVSQLIIPF